MLLRSSRQVHRARIAELSRANRRHRQVLQRVVESLEPRLLLTTFLVNDAADLPDNDLTDGICEAGDKGSEMVTLRAAIQNANLTVDLDAISFNLPSTQTTIRPLSALPEITASLIIDGYTQSGAPSQ